MVIFPNCKINIGLNIVGKRSDGYHDLETIFFPVPLCDALEVITTREKDNFSQTGLPISGDPSVNLCVKALQLVRSQFPDLPAVKLHLHKAIPMGSGLGGGSSDGANTLLLLNKKFSLGLSTSMLIEMALQLGSDCPFFIENKTCFAWSRGEMMEPLELDLKGYTLLLINPGIHVSTPWAFSQITPRLAEFSLKELSTIPISNWKEFVVNDFQEAVAKHHPVIDSIVQTCYEAGAMYAAMSGSGSTCFALFKPGVFVPEIPAFQPYWVKQINLS
jgi:4-diphosphocytidyl-2-C-methyl-D-erythritol kinase